MAEELSGLLTSESHSPGATNSDGNEQATFPFLVATKLYRGFIILTLIAAFVGWVKKDLSAKGLIVALAFLFSNIVISKITKVSKLKLHIELFRLIILNGLLDSLAYLWFDGPLSSFWYYYLMISIAAGPVLVAVTPNDIFWGRLVVLSQIIYMWIIRLFFLGSVDYYSLIIHSGIIFISGFSFIQIIHSLQASINREHERSFQLKASLEKVTELQHALLQSARQAGMAEIAIGVLHNVGNVLNSVNTSANLIAKKANDLRISEIEDTAELLRSSDLPALLGDSAKRTALEAFLQKLALVFKEDKSFITKEAEALNKNVDHIKTIINLQQEAARSSHFVEPVDINELIQDALKLSETSFGKHGLEVIRECNVNPPVVAVDRHKLMQIVVNLVSNAKHALKESPIATKTLTVRIQRENENWLRLDVADNGIGIPHENMAKVFSHGFTTKKEGHGFGLHNSALLAKEMGGTLNFASEGAGKGAVFTLKFPFKLPEIR